MRSNLYAVRPYPNLSELKNYQAGLGLTLTNVMSDVNDIRTTSSGHLVCDTPEVYGQKTEL